MMQQAHVLNLISDYVLGLLPATEQHLVEQHTASCGLCRQQLAAERTLSRNVHAALAALPIPHPIRLAQLQPRKRVSRWPLVFHSAWYKGWVTLGVLLAIFAGSLYMRPSGETGGNAWSAPGNFVVATATMTATATATQTANNIDLPHTPTAAATPIAALPVISNSQ